MRPGREHIINWARNIVTGGLAEEFSVEMVRKIVMLNVMGIVGVLTMFPLSLLAFIQGDSVVGSLSFSVAFLLTANLLYLRRSGRYEFVCYVGIVMVGALFLYFFVSGRTNNTGFLWCYTFPLISSFLLGSKRGAVSASVMLFCVLVYFLMDTGLPGFATYTTQLKIRFTASLLVVFAFSFLFERLRENTQEKLANKNIALEKSLSEQKETEAAVRNAHDSLEERVKERTNELRTAYEKLQQGDQRVRERTAKLTMANNRLKKEIEERELVARALRESENRLKSIFDSLLTGIVVIEEESHTIVDVNPRAAELIGTRKEEIVGRRCFEFICSAVEGQCPVSDLGQTITRAESVLLNRWGGRIPVLKTVIPIEVNGRRHLIDSFVDITEQKRAKEALKLSEEQLRKINEALSEGMSDVFKALDRISSGDPSVRIPETSRLESIAKLKHIVNLTAENLGEIVDLSHEFAIGLAEHFNALHRVSEGDLSARVEGVSHVELLGSLKHVTNEMIGNVSREIRERKRAEEAFRNAKDEAVSASIAKSEFLANMSHEIRTPMNAIMGMTHIVLGSELNKEQREYLNTVRVASESLLTLLNDILDFSKIEARQLQLDEANFNLRTTLENALELLAVKAEEVGIELACHIKPDVVTALVGDPARLRQIIVNLTGNAIKFTDQGQVTVSVTTEEEGEGCSAFLHFAVSDTGIGIPSEKTEEIFDSFKQADGSAKRKYGGTGLGLAISKQLVEMMGGQIWVESELGLGSTFHFTARFELSGEEAIESLRIKDLDLTGVPLLLVDANATNRMVLGEMTSLWGLNPSEAADQSEALSKIQEAYDSGQPYQIILVDSGFSGMEGFEMAKQVKESPAGKDAKVILLTSIGKKGDAAECLRFGISAYLVKPVKQSDLLDAILMVLGHATDETSPLVTRYTIEEARRRLRILVVEDNVVNQKVAMAMLEKRGHSVAVASDGREALSALREDKFDLILMDVQMPEMDGFEATRLIRDKEREHGGHIPVVAMTAHAMKGDRERCLAAGMDDYLSKPIREERLFSVIEGLANGLQDGNKAKPPFIIGDIHPKAQDVFDFSKAMKTVNGDEALFNEITALFLESAADNLSKIRKGILNKDAGVVEHAAHNLKGSVANFGAKRAFDAAYRLEQMGKDGKLTAAESANLELEKEFKALESALQAAMTRE
jgi:two-component system sensor histidine kinase/response regulator